MKKSIIVILIIMMLAGSIFTAYADVFVYSMTAMIDADGNSFTANGEFDVTLTVDDEAKTFVYAVGAIENAGTFHTEEEADGILILSTAFENGWAPEITYDINSNTFDINDVESGMIYHMEIVQ